MTRRSDAGVAPPYTRRIAPFSSSSVRSRRTVSADTPSRRTSSSVLTACPALTTASTIASCRSTGSMSTDRTCGCVTVHDYKCGVLCISRQPSKWGNRHCRRQRQTRYHPVNFVNSSFLRPLVAEAARFPDEVRCRAIERRCTSRLSRRRSGGTVPARRAPCPGTARRTVHLDHNVDDLLHRQGDLHLRCGDVITRFLVAVPVHPPIPGATAQSGPQRRGRPPFPLGGVVRAPDVRSPPGRGDVRPQ